MLGARLARATFEPDLLVSDGEAFFVANAGRSLMPSSETSGVLSPRLNTEET